MPSSKTKETIHMIHLNGLPIRDGLVDSVVEALGGMVLEPLTPMDDIKPVENPTTEDKLNFIKAKIAEHVTPFLVATLDKATNAEIEDNKAALRLAEKTKRDKILGQVSSVLGDI